MVNNNYVLKVMGLNMTEIEKLILNVTEEAAIQKQHIDCKKYGTFMTQLSREGLEGIFWSLFVVVFALLITAADSHAKSEQLYLYDRYHLDEAEELKVRHRCQRVKAVVITTACFVGVAFCLVMEALAGCALNYCKQHKVIWFYWGLWTLTQVGSFIAIVGVTVHQWACLGEHSTPPWNVALGTPILVITAVAWIVGTWIRKKWAAFTGAEQDETEAEVPDLLPPAGILHGIANDGSMIVQFHGDEWQQLPGFQPGSVNKHGGATGKLALASSIQLHSPASKVTLRDISSADSSGPNTPSGLTPPDSTDLNEK